jgi:hypothetical protein
MDEDMKTWTRTWGRGDMETWRHEHEDMGKHGNIQIWTWRDGDMET